MVQRLTDLQKTRSIKTSWGCTEAEATGIETCTYPCEFKGLGLGLKLEVPQNIDVKIVKEALGFRSAGCFGHEKS